MTRSEGVALPFARTVVLCGGSVVGIGLLVFFGGWVLDVTALQNVIPGTVAMKASTASALTSLGLSLLLLRDPGASVRRRRAGRLCALFSLGVGLAFLSEFALGWDLGIDEFPFEDTLGRAQGVPHPGRLAPMTAVNLVLAGSALLTLDLHADSRWRPSELFAVPVAAVASMSLIGYTYAIPAFYGPGSATKMAVNTAACFVAIAAGIVLARPHGRLRAFATTTAPGGTMARRVFPLVVIMPLALGWLRLEASDAGLFGDRIGTWWLTAATIVAMVVLLWRAAVHIDRADTGRQELERLLYEQANRDQMTGLYNRRRFQEEMVRHTARVRRHGGTTTMMMIDLDGLKRVNDELGHAAGDVLITGVCHAIAGRVRGTDLVGRLGGDEVGVLLLNSSPEGAVGVAKDLVAAIRDARPSTVPIEAWSTASIGIAYSEDLRGDHADTVLARADQAMYAAKRAGGDRFCSATPHFAAA